MRHGPLEDFLVWIERERERGVEGRRRRRLSATEKVFPCKKTEERMEEEETLIELVGNDTRE